MTRRRSFICFLWLQLFSYPTLFAQQQSLSLSGGLSFRAGYSSLNAFGNHLSGYVKPGGMADFTYQRQLNQSHFALAISVKGKLTKVVPEMIPLHGVKKYFADRNLAAFSTIALMTGISYHTDPAKRWYLQSQLLVGFARQWLGKTYAKGVQPVPGSDDVYIYVAESKPTTANGPSAAFKIGPVFHLGKRIELLVPGEYWLVLSEMKTSGTYSTGHDLVIPYYYEISNAGQFTSKPFVADHLEKNLSTFAATAGIRLKL